MYTAGWARRPIAIEPQGYAMHGYGQWHHRARGVETSLYSRALTLAWDDDRPLLFCCLDLGYITRAMRKGVCQRLANFLGPAFDPERLVLTCTHTHSGPGGCAQEGLYNLVTPGYVPEHVDAIIEATCDALLAALDSAQPGRLLLAEGRFGEPVEVAWNRALKAYNRNPEVIPVDRRHSHRALDRSMPVLAVERDGQIQALLSLFGVHATCVGNQQGRYDGDNKGYAALAAEASLAEAGATEPVAIFAQATAGDVSPHYHGPGQNRRRRRLRGRAEYRYARRNGQHQASLALAALAAASVEIRGPIDGVLSYLDFSHRRAAPAFANGEPDACTSEPCHGVAFFAGTPVDGPGMPRALARMAALLSRRLKRRRLSRPSPSDSPHYQRLYRSQGNKDILLEAGSKRLLGQPLRQLRLPDVADPAVAELKRQARAGALDHSPLVPSVLPLQIITLGNVAMVCCPGEFTTVAGQRLRETVARQLATLPSATAIERVLICTYCNEYMGYVTTFEEYQAQCYEGGHTLYGQWTLAAFQTEFSALAGELTKPAGARQHDRDTVPAEVPARELALRSNLAPPQR